MQKQENGQEFPGEVKGGWYTAAIFHRVVPSGICVCLKIGYIPNEIAI